MNLHLFDARLRFTWAVATHILFSLWRMLLVIYGKPTFRGPAEDMRTWRRAIVAFYRECVTTFAEARAQWARIATALESRDPEVPGSWFLKLLIESENANKYAHTVVYSAYGVPRVGRPVGYELQQRLMKLAAEEALSHHQRLVVAQR